MKTRVKAIVFVLLIFIVTGILVSNLYKISKETNKMKIGYSAADITPPLGVELCGYGYYPERKSEGIQDHLFARALLLDDGNKRLLLINCDILALSQQIVDEVKQKLNEKLGLNKKDILILSTHTHTAPSASDTAGMGERDENYVKSLPALLAKAGVDATENTRQVKQVKQLKAELVKKVGYNRVNPSGPVDNDLRSIAFYLESGRPLAILSYGCHPVTLGPSKMISADYPGAVITAMDKAGYDSLFLNAFCGDIDPISNIVNWGSGTQETIDGYGNTIANTFLKKIDEAETMEDLSLDSYEVSVDIKTENLTNEALDNIVKKSSGEKDANPGRYKLIQVWADRMKDNIKNSKSPYKKTLNVQAFKIGKVLMVGFPAEMFTALGDPLKEAFPEMNVMALGNANSTIGYIATHEDIENAGYAGFESSFVYLTLPLKAGEGENLANEVTKELKSRIKKVN